MQISNKIQQFSINDTVIINPSEITEYLENVSSRLSNYQLYIDSKYDNLSTILNNINIEVDQAVLDGILNAAELKSIQLATEEFKSQVKSIVVETQDILNQLYIDNSILLDNEVYTFTNYTYIPTQKPYVLQISIKKNPAEVGCRDALQWCLSELNEDNSKTIYATFLRCINALCISDTNPDTPDIDINKDLLDQYYQTRDTMLNHINIAKNVLVVSKKRIQEKIVDKQTADLNKLVDDQKSYVDTIRNSLANQIDGVLDSYFLPGPPSTNINSKVVSGWINDVSIELNLTTTNANVNNTSTQTVFNRHIGDTYTDILPYEVNLQGEAAKWFILGDIKQNLNSLYENNLVESLTHYRTHDLFTYEPGTKLKNNNENLQIVVCYYNASKVLKHIEYVNPGETTILQQSAEFSYIGLLIYPNDTIDLTTVSIVHDNLLKYINAGRSWRFCNFDDEDVTTYHWHEIADSDAILALQKAAEAQDTADGKRTVFSTQPTVPYYMGDLWIAPGADISICAIDNTDRSLGFVNEHWVKASKYTDDTLAMEAIEDAKSAKQSAEEAQKRFADMANDGIVDPVEKTSLRAEYTTITEQHNILLREVANIKNLYNKEIDTTDLEKAKNDLKEYLTYTLHIWDEPDIAQPINRNDFNTITNAWYNESIIISNAIAKYTAEGISQTYSEILQEKIDDISEEQKSALKLLEDMSSDGVLDPAEKLRVQTQYIEITSQHNENVKLANLYKGLVDISALVNYYDNLTSYLVESPCFIYNGKSSEIDRGDFNKVFENWYNENVKVLTLLQSVISKEEAEKVKVDVQKEIDEANKAAEEAAKMLNDMMSDGILDAAEKIKIRQQLKEIEAEHTETILIANDYTHFGNVSTGINNLITAYTTLTNTMQLYNIDSSTSEEIDRETFDDPFINWHKYNTQLLSAVSFAMAEQEANNVKIDIQDEIRNSAQMALEAQNMLDDMLDDNKIDKTEKVRLRKELDEISVQHTTNVALANDYGLPTIDIQNAFNNLSEYLIDVIIIYSDETKVLGENDRTNLNAYFANWYQENTKLLNNISYIIATDVVVDLSTAISTKIDDAVADAAESKALVADIMDDGVIDPSEKTRLKQQFSEIQTQHAQNREHAVILDVEPQYIQDFDNALQHLEGVLVNTCCINTNESTRNVNRTILNGAFNDWHSCNVILLNKISDKQASNKTAEMQQEVNKMIEDASNAQAATQALVDAILDDNTIDPSEKTRLKLQFAEITTSYNDLIELCNNNNIQYIDYILLTNVYDALKSYLENVCSINTSGNTAVNREEFSKKFTDYYKEYNTLLNKVQTAIAQKEAAAIAKEQEDFINALQKSLDEYAKKQEDGRIVSYFLPGNPTTTNKPASEWLSYEVALEHVGDTYTNSDENDPDYGKSWRWCVSEDCDDPTNNLQFHWHEITDPLTLKALQAAENAQDTADGKRRVFVVQPTPPYDKGDLWVTTLDNDGDGENDMYVANTAKAEGETYNKDDWQPATSAFEHINSLQEKIDAAKSELLSFADDNVLTPVEKKQMRTTLLNISTNHANDQLLAKSLNLQNQYVYIREETAYDNLYIYLVNTVNVNTNVSSAINRDTLSVYLDAWYSANANLDTSIKNKMAQIEIDKATKDLSARMDMVATAQASTYLTAAIEQCNTDIQGGLVLTSLIELRGMEGNINAGMSGMDYVVLPEGYYVHKNNPSESTQDKAYAAKDDTLLWAGGDYAASWKAQYNLQKLPVRITKSGVGSNLGPFKVKDNDAIVVESTHGNIEVDVDKGIYVYDQDSNLSIALHNSYAPQYEMPVHNNVWAGYSFKNTYWSGTWQEYAHRRFCYGNTFTPQSTYDGEFEFNTNIPNTLSVTLALPEKEVIRLLKNSNLSESRSYSNIDNITRVIRNNVSVNIDYFGLKFYETDSIPNMASATSVTMKNTGSWYSSQTEQPIKSKWDDSSSLYSYKTNIFEFDRGVGNLIICDDPIYLDGKKVTYTQSSYAKAIGIYSYIPSDLSNDFDMNKITVNIGKPVKTFIKENNSKNSFYTYYVNSDGKCTHQENVTIADVFIEKSIGETDGDLNRKIFDHLQSIEPSDYSYLWYVFDVTFDFTKILKTNKLKFTYDLRHDNKQYVYGIGFSLSANIIDRPDDWLVWGLGFNDNIQSGYIRKSLQNTTQIYRDKFILCDKSYGQRFEVTLGNKKNELNPLFMNIMGLPNEEMVVNMYNNTSHPYRNFLNSGLVYVDTNGYLRLYGHDQSGLNIN